MTTIEAIRAKCIEANPNLWERTTVAVAATIPIRLADVLLAWKQEEQEHGDDEHIFNFFQKSDVLAQLIHSWNLRNDDLSAQSEETIEFIGKVLGV